MNNSHLRLFQDNNNDAVNNNGRAQQLADLFQGSQVHVKVDVCQSTDPQQIRDRIFDKLLINCAINSKSIRT